MPMKLSVGLAKKIGQPDYGSLGASCHVEFEVDSALLQGDPEAFHRHVRVAYQACRTAVEEQVAHSGSLGERASRNGHSAANANGHRNGNGRAFGSANGASRQVSARRATPSQVRAIHAISSRHGIDAAAELQARYGVERPEELSVADASEFIDVIKSLAEAAAGRR